PDWGAAIEQLLRLARPAYPDGKSAPAGSTRPSARAISNALDAHPAEEMPNARHLSAYAYAWGQFIDHDLDLTNSASPAEEFDIQVPKGDPFFDPGNTGTQTISLTRSVYDPTTGTTNPRQQLNVITSFLDGSMVYGSDSARDMALRTGVGGLLKTSAGNLLPYNTMGLNMDTGGSPAPADSFFAAGDVRANENIELTSMQTLFMREHNRLATQIAQQNPSLSDEQIFQRARRLVIGEIQSITYNEYLPAILGSSAINSYSGYKSWVNPAISTEFSTAAFRFGHSMLADDVEFLDNNGEDVQDEMPLKDAFFNPGAVPQTGIDPILKYLASSNSEEVDNKIVDGLRNFLFGPPGAGGLDLASLNIQRGRDHGLADYNSTRAAMGLPRVQSFGQITSDPDLQQALKDTYGSVNNIDLWVGGLAENHLPGSSFGPTFQKILVDQFTRTRDGDRYWYERDLSGGDLRFVRNATLADVLKRNTTLTNLQSNVFVFDVRVTGRLWNDRDGDGRIEFGERAISGRNVSLIDEDGNVVDTAKTDRNGFYEFAGVQVGHYHVTPDLPSGWITTTDGSVEIDVTRGQKFDRVNFGQKISPNASPAVAASDPSIGDPITTDPIDSVASDVLDVSGAGVSSIV
ncbi:MAG TPA: peroxidase family protein, partial [Tepidisphaeraceae bacterium]